MLFSIWLNIYAAHFIQNDEPNSNHLGDRTEWTQKRLFSNRTNELNRLTNLTVAHHKFCYSKYSGAMFDLKVVIDACIIRPLQKFAKLLHPSYEYLCFEPQMNDNFHSEMRITVGYLRTIVYSPTYIQYWVFGTILLVKWALLDATFLFNIEKTIGSNEELGQSTKKFLFPCPCMLYIQF